MAQQVERVGTGRDTGWARDVQAELPVGSELMIAVALGISGWWAIARVVMWLAG